MSRVSRFGPVPLSDAEVMNGFLGGAEFVFTGPEHWNALGLGATAVFPVQWVYNRRLSGTFRLERRTYVLHCRRFPYPTQPVEWVVVDLFDNADAAGVASETLVTSLRRSVRSGCFDPARLILTAKEYGSPQTVQLICATCSKTADQSRPAIPTRGTRQHSALA